MKCTLCNDRNGSTRCEGCQQLYCLPCMNKHHDSLTEDFQLLMHDRNELRESLNMMKSTSRSDKTLLVIKEIDRWERKTTENIRTLATQMRNEAQEIIVNKLTEVDLQFNNLTKDIQRREKEGNYLENDIIMVKKQLEQLQNEIEQINTNIYLDTTPSKSVSWNTLIRIVNEYSERTKDNVEEFKSISAQKPVQLENMNASSRNSSDLNQIELDPIQIPIIDFPHKHSLDSNRPLDHSRQCVACKQYFEKLSLNGSCAACEYRKNQQISQKYVHPSPAYPNANHILRQHTPSGYRGPIKVMCNHCRNINLLQNIHPKVRPACSKCRAYLNVPHH